MRSMSRLVTLRGIWLLSCKEPSFLGVPKLKCRAEIDVLSPVPHQKKMVVGSFEGFQQVTAKGCDLQGIAQCNFWQRRSKASTALADFLDQLQCVISWIHYIVENGTMDDNGWQWMFNGKKHFESAAVDFPIKTSYKYVICRCLESTIVRSPQRWSGSWSVATVRQNSVSLRPQVYLNESTITRDVSGETVIHSGHLT